MPSQHREPKQNVVGGQGEFHSTRGGSNKSAKKKGKSDAREKCVEVIKDPKKKKRKKTHPKPGGGGWFCFFGGTGGRRRQGLEKVGNPQVTKGRRDKIKKKLRKGSTPSLPELEQEGKKVGGGGGEEHEQQSGES